MKTVVKNCLLIIATFAIIFESNSQFGGCGFDEIHRELLLKNPDYAKRVKRFDERSKHHIPNKTDSDIQVPVVVHLVHTGSPIGEGVNRTDLEVETIIAELNRYLRKDPLGYGNGTGEDTKIEYVLAVRDENGNCTNGIVREDLSSNQNYVNCGVNRILQCGISDQNLKQNSWDPSEYYNIYVVSEIDDANCNVGGVAGYATLAAYHGNSIDGTVINACNFFDPFDKTLTHEIGHSLNLYHTFEGDNLGNSCPTDQNGCGNNLGDCCGDTPAHIRTLSQASLFFDCGNSGINACQPSGTVQDHITNYMDYSDCGSAFTLDQKNRMTDALLNSRASFLFENGNLSLVPPGLMESELDFYTPSRFVCRATDFQLFSNINCIPNSSQNTPFEEISFFWEIDGTFQYNSTEQNPIFNIPNLGVFDVSLTVYYKNDTFNITKYDYLTVENASNNGCFANNANQGAFGQTILNVNFNEIINLSSSLHNTIYENFSCQHTTGIVAGASYEMSISVRSGATGNEFFSVYIDYNNDNIFQASEKVFNGSTGQFPSIETFTTTINIPQTAVRNRKLIMRVVGEAQAEADLNMVNCNSNFFVGEVEDYGVFIGDPISQNTTISGENSYCVGNIVYYRCTPVNNATSYVWEFPEGTTILSGQSTTSVQILAGSVSGNVSVTPINNVSSGNTTNFAITAFDQDNCDKNINGVEAVCRLDTASFKYTDADINNSYTWSVPQGATILFGQGTDSIVVLFGTMSGNINLAIDNNNALLIELNKPIEVMSNTTPSVLISTDQIIQALCPNDILNVNAIVDEAGLNPSYRWKVNGQFVTDATSFMSSTLNYLDEVSCTIINSNFCSSVDSVNSNTLTIDRVLVDTSLFFDGEFIHAIEMNADFYQWFTCNGLTLSGHSQSQYKPTINNSYRVQIIKNNCIVNSQCIDIRTLSINDSKKAQIKIYPNPNKGSFTIQTDHNLKGADFEIFNLLGKEVFSGQIEAQNNISIDVPKGVYLLRLPIDNFGYSIRKLVVE